MRGSNLSRHSLKVLTGSGSKGQDVIEADFIAFKTSSSETSVNSPKVVVHVLLSWTWTDDMVEVASLFCSFLIFSLKNVANELAKSLGLSWSGRLREALGEVSLSMTRKRSRWLASATSLLWNSVFDLVRSCLFSSHCSLYNSLSTVSPDFIHFRPRRLLSWLATRSDSVYQDACGRNTRVRSFSGACLFRVWERFSWHPLTIVSRSLVGSIESRDDWISLRNSEFNIYFAERATFYTLPAESRTGDANKTLDSKVVRW